MPHVGILLLNIALKKRKKLLVNIAFLTSIINILALAPSIYMLQIYDRALQSRNEITLLMLSLIIIVILAISALLEYIRSMITIHASKKIDDELSKLVVKAEFQSRIKSPQGHSGFALSDITTLRQFLTGNALFAFFDAPWFPIYLGVIFLFNPWLGLFALAGAIILIALALLNEKLTAGPLQQAVASSRKANWLVGSQLRQAEVIEAMGMFEALQQRWRVAQEKFITYQLSASEHNTTISSCTRFVRMSLQSLILGLGAWLVIRGELTPGMMIAGSILLSRSLSPIEQIIGAWKQWKNVQGALKRTHQLLTENPPRQPGLALPAPLGYLRAEKISATAPGNEERLLINQVSFALKPGEILGIVGNSGSGKSTLARLVLGVWPLKEGTVRLDDADIHQWPREALGQWVGWLPQECGLLAGTVAQNIARFGEVDTEKVITAARLAGVHEMILHLPAGYDTPVGDEGMGLSGGQKQRIALARALYGNPRLVVLDEPDASLDDTGLVALLQTLIKLKQQKIAVILITHRKSILPATNKLLVLVQGKVAHYGTTRDILTANAPGAQAASPHGKTTGNPTEKPDAESPSRILSYPEHAVTLDDKQGIAHVHN